MAILVRVAPIAYVMINRCVDAIIYPGNSSTDAYFNCHNWERKKKKQTVSYSFLFSFSATLIQSSSVLNTVPVGMGIELSTSYHDR